MRLTLGYRVIYAAILMGSYTRSIVIGGILGLVGIGICFAIEQRWRNMGRPPSGTCVAQTTCARARNNGSQTVIKGLLQSGGSLRVDDITIKREDGTKNTHDINVTKQAEDDVTYLFGPLSTMSIHDKSSPGLPWMGVDPISMINLTMLESVSDLLVDTTENFESGDTLSLEQQCEIQLDGNTPKFSWMTRDEDDMTKLVSCEEQLNESTIIINNTSELSESIYNEVDMTTLVSCEEQLKESAIIINNTPDLSGSTSNGEAVASKNNLVSCEGQSKKTVTLITAVSDLPRSNANSEGVKRDHQKFSEPHLLVEDATKVEDFEEETSLPVSYPSPILEKYTSELSSPNLQGTARLLDDDKALPTYSGLSEEVHFPKSGSSHSIRSVKNRLDASCVKKNLISSVSPINRNLVQESTSNALINENTKSVKVRDSLPTLKNLVYSDLAAVPKKKINHVSKPSNKEEVKVEENHQVGDKNRVLKLVGFFENRSDKT